MRWHVSSFRPPFGVFGAQRADGTMYVAGCRTPSLIRKRDVSHVRLANAAQKQHRARVFALYIICVCVLLYDNTRRDTAETRLLCNFALKLQRRQQHRTRYKQQHTLTSHLARAASTPSSSSASTAWRTSQSSHTTTYVESRVRLHFPQSSPAAPVVVDDDVVGACVLSTHAWAHIHAR